MQLVRLKGQSASSFKARSAENLISFRSFSTDTWEQAQSRLGQVEGWSESNSLIRFSHVLSITSLAFAIELSLNTR